MLLLQLCNLMVSSHCWRIPDVLVGVKAVEQESLSSWRHKARRPLAPSALFIQQTAPPWSSRVALLARLASSRRASSVFTRHAAPGSTSRDTICVGMFIVRITDDQRNRFFFVYTDLNVTFFFINLCQFRHHFGGDYPPWLWRPVSLKMLIGCLYSALKTWLDVFSKQNKFCRRRLDPRYV